MFITQAGQCGSEQRALYRDDPLLCPFGPALRRFPLRSGSKFRCAPCRLRRLHGRRRRLQNWCCGAIGLSRGGGVFEGRCGIAGLGRRFGNSPSSLRLRIIFAGGRYDGFLLWWPAIGRGTHDRREVTAVFVDAHRRTLLAPSGRKGKHRLCIDGIRVSLMKSCPADSDSAGRGALTRAN